MASKYRDTIKDSERYSILTDKFDVCYICGKRGDTQLHEVFYGQSNRPKSKEDGCTAPLCYECHHGSNFGVHFNKELDLRLKKQTEKIWLDHYTNKDLPMSKRIKMFIKRYGKNYLDEEDY